MHDLRYAIRVLRNNPGFSLAAILTLALGIGLNATIFSLFDAVALRPIELPGPRTPVALYEDVRGIGRSTFGRDHFTYSEYLQYRDHSDVFSGLAAYMPEVTAMLDEPVRGQLASCNYFTALEIPMTVGRGFAPADCAVVDAGAVVVLDHDTWRTRFNGDRQIVGTQIKLNRIPFTVIGVASPSFHGLELMRAAFWAPLTMQRPLTGQTDAAFVNRDDMAWLALAGRLKDGITLSQARANLGLIASQIDLASPPRATTLTVQRASFIGADKKQAAMAIGAAFLIAVSLVLLIGCANVANLFLARAIVRQREIAVRLAMGASRARLVRQLLAESAVVALAGGVLGTFVAIWSAGAIARFIANDPTSSPITLNVAPDLRVFAYTLGLVALATVGFGLVPALQATRPDLNRTLKADDTDPGVGRRWLRHWLVGGQVATCMILLLVAGLFLRGLERVQTLDPGWSMDGATQLTFDLSREGYDTGRAQAFLRQLDVRLHALPGVDAVTSGTTSPLGSAHHFAPFGPPGAAKPTITEFAGVGPGYVSLQRIPLVRGRDFTAADVGSRRNLVIINEAAARTFWPGEDPVGKTLYGFKNTDYEVVGIARDAEVSELGKAHVPYLYVAASPGDALDVKVALIRSSAPYAAVANAARAAALSLDHDLHVKVAPLRDNIRPYIQASELLGAVSSLLGGLALVLACIGIYGTVAFAVARRRREIGIRVALGAQGDALVRLIVSQSMRAVVIGAGAGRVVCAVAARFLAPILLGVSSHDAVAFAGVPLVLLGVALAASYLPARRAARVDAMAVLRRT